MIPLPPTPPQPSPPLFPQEARRHPGSFFFSCFLSFFKSAHRQDEPARTAERRQSSGDDVRNGGVRGRVPRPSPGARSERNGATASPRQQSQEIRAERIATPVTPRNKDPLPPAKILNPKENFCLFLPPTKKGEKSRLYIFYCGQVRSTPVRRITRSERMGIQDTND